MDTESQNIEFKQLWRDEYLKWICGFANAQGGTIYIGVDDSGNVKGLENIHRLSEDIPNKIATHLGIVADVNILIKDKKHYLEINVQPSNIPISLNGIYHYRSGSTKQELKGIALQQFLLKKLGMSWDDMPHETDSTETVLENLNLITDDGKIRNAAILLFADNPQRYFPGSEFKIGRFGVSESDLMFQDIVEGNIIQMTERVIEFLRSKYLISNIHYEGLQRVERLEIPEDALRELINNAICHKDYMGVAIQMKVYNDRIELWDDGFLPDGMIPDDLLKPHKSKPRNKLISAAFYRAGFIETWGRGIEKVCNAFDDAKMRRPVFEFTCGGLNTIIYRPNDTINDTTNDTINDTINDPVNDRQKQILKYISTNPQITTLELIEKLNVSKPTIKRDLRILSNLGFIARVGANKNGYWKILLQK